MGDKLASSSTDTSKCSTPDPSGCTDGSGLKMSPNNDPCILCSSSLDTEKSDASALHATVVSQKFSCESSSSGTVSQAVKCPDTVPDNLSCSNSSPQAAQSANTVQGSLSDQDSCAGDDGAQNNLCKTEGLPTSSETCVCSSNSDFCGVSNPSHSENKSLDTISKTVIERYLCYGCRIILREMVSKFVFIKNHLAPFTHVCMSNYTTVKQYDVCYLFLILYISIQYIQLHIYMQYC